MKTLVPRSWYPQVIAVHLPVLFHRTGQLSILLYRLPVPTRRNQNDAGIQRHVSRNEMFRICRTCLLTRIRSLGPTRSYD